LTCLHFATQEGHTEIAKLLIEKGAGVNAKDKYNENTPLHMAVQEGYTEIAKLLIEKGADVNTLNKDGNTPLHIAINKVGGDILFYKNKIGL
jgi:ankyrin repeat protein